LVWFGRQQPGLRTIEAVSSREWRCPRKKEGQGSELGTAEKVSMSEGRQAGNRMRERQEREDLVKSQSSKKV
jgi:hypothetical protein